LVGRTLFKKPGACVKIKICGITNLEDALSVFFAGADALGFVFYKKSPRYISLARAQKICRILPKKILRVGVFVNEKIPQVKQIARTLRLDMLQFHGQETAEYCRQFKGYKVIKAFRIKEAEDLNKVSGYRNCAYLFDSFSGREFGGTGKKFNWKILARANKMKPAIFISGGLSPANVRQAVKLLKPDWVDASSCLESKPGKKDQRKIKKFVQALRGK
jgi:phosphoribosylanthranilate isomerase